MSRLYLILLLVLTMTTRLWNISQPETYVFDEVYHVVTVKAYAKNNPAGYEWWHKPPEPNTAYEWLHPPLAKLIQAASVRLLGNNSFAWRFPSAVFGTLSVLAVYYLALSLFKKQKLALTAAFFLSMENLHLTMSRITMNDVFVTTFITLALTFFYRFLSVKKTDKKNLYLTGFFTGLSLATKHSSVLLFPVFALFLLFFRRKNILAAFYYLFIIPLSIYLISFTQFFLQGHTLSDFYHLHQQIWWYQAGLTATHDYQSVALSWPLLLRPVWFHVEYLQDKIANIYNLGNPAVFWGGLMAFGYGAYMMVVKKWRKLPFYYLFASYLIMFLPLALSPRILFLHHFLPAVPLLCVILARALDDNKSLLSGYLILSTLLFIFFYPLNTAIAMPADWLKYWFWLPGWK